MDLKRRLPWWAKMGAKLVLSRIPVRHRVWQRLGLFQHGYMEQPRYAVNVFRKHYERAQLSPGFNVVEIGPGDMLSSAIIAKAMGGARSYLIDVAAFARQDFEPYQHLIEMLRADGLPVGDLCSCSTLNDLLSACNAVYLTDGVDSFRHIPDASVDLLFSQAVLEHVRRKDFRRLVKEMRRILRPGGVASHCVDLRDHLGGKLNNLRFSERVWEHDFMAQSGFYTNRIRFREMLAEFEQGGFRCDVASSKLFEHFPTPRSSMAVPFSTLAEDDLMVAGFDVVLR